MNARREKHRYAEMRAADVGRGERRRPASWIAAVTKRCARGVRAIAAHVAGVRRTCYADASSGIFSISTNPMTNNAATDRTPMLGLPVTWVNTLTRNVPMTAAYLPNMSKKP